ncbi:MAG TPA: hypothetical protein VFA86_06540 [Gammaproteobacteria bacterium]|nr:hypothetical protein [Gammaproteobacteria bacterium]
MRATSARSRIWQSMRVLRRFDVPQLMATAEASRNNVGRFVLGLRRAGVIRVVRQHCNGHAGDCAVYQLVRNLGPHAPRVRIDGTCWDPNGQRFIGGEDD